MKVDGTHYRSLWWDHERDACCRSSISAGCRKQFRIQQVNTLQDYADSIVEMRVRGAPLIGATAAYGMALAMRLDPSDAAMDQAWRFLNATRPDCNQLALGSGPLPQHTFGHWVSQRACRNCRVGSGT